MKPIYTHTPFSMRFFLWMNFAAFALFMCTSAFLLKFDWHNNEDNIAGYVHGSAYNTNLFQRLSSEPRVALFFGICVLSLTWLVGFFTLGIMHVHEIVVLPSASANADIIAKPKKTQEEKVSQPSKSTVTPEQATRKHVAILGGTGLVGRALAIRLQQHPSMQLGFLVGSPDTAGKPVSQVWEKKEAILKRQYGDMWQPMVMPPNLAETRVASFDDIFTQSSPSQVIIISCVAPALGWMEDQLIEKGFNVFSISPHARTRPGVPLIVPEVNGPKELRKLLASRETENGAGKLVKSPNCVSCGACLVLDALSKAYGGLDEISLTTFQSLSGRGDALYDQDLVVGNVLPLGKTIEDTNTKIREEVTRVLDQPDLRISVTAQRVYTQRGHYVDVRVKTRHPIPSEHHVALALERYSPFANTPYANLPDAPKQGGPIRVCLEPQWPRPVQAVRLGGLEDDGMTVHVGHISTDDRVFDLSLSFVVDNVARGAYGAALLMAELYDTMENQQ